MHPNKLASKKAFLQYQQQGMERCSNFGRLEHVLVIRLLFSESKSFGLWIVLES